MAVQVRYVGTSTIRRITAADWQKAGVKDMETVEWNRANGWSVPRDKISQDALPFIESDQSMVLFDPDTGEQEPARGRQVRSRALTAPVQPEGGPPQEPLAEDSSELRANSTKGGRRG